MVSLSRLLSKFKWKIFSASSRQEEEEAQKFGDLLTEIFPTPKRTKEEAVEFEAALKKQYLQEVPIPLLKSESLRVTDDEKWKFAILLLRNLPVQFRVKFIESSQVTPWQTHLEQGIYDSYFMFPSHGSIAYKEMEWLELDASRLSEKELEHFGKFMHEKVRIMHRHSLPLSRQLWRLFGYYESSDEI